MKRKKLEKKSLKAVIALAVALAFVMPGAAAFANVGTFGVTSNSENTGDIENIVEISTNSDTSDNTETTSDANYNTDTITTLSTGTIYVDDDNTAGPWDGSMEYPYQYIQDGVDNAIAGNTVYVYNGTYTESDMLVDKSLNLVGESKEGVIVDSNPESICSFMFVQVSNTNISSFTMKNGMLGIWIDCSNTDVEHINITNCIIHDNAYYGICTGGSDAKTKNSIIKNCEVYNAGAVGLSLASFTSSIVSECDIHDNVLGIDFMHVGGQNTIYHNNFVSNTEHAKAQETPGECQTWDSGYPSGGNYWEGYTGIDEYRGPYQDIPGSDGIGDTAYLVVEDAVYNIDNYPLMYPWGTPPEITDVTATPKSQSIGGNINITCTVEDIHNGVKPAIVYITDPSGYQQEFEKMTGINVDYLGNGEYYYNATYSMIGIYNYFIRAENRRDCRNESDTYQFEMEGSDTVPPVTNCTLMGTVGENDWYVSDVEVNLTVTDPPPSSGINYTMYKLDGTNWTEYTNPFTVTTDGTHTVEYNSTDNASNIESTKSMDFKIDKTDPVTTHSLSGTMGNNGWYTSNVVVTLTASDVTSGINYTMYNLDGTGWTEYGSITVTTDGYHTVEYNSTDNASNIESTKSMDFKIDQTAPETSCELDPPEPDGENGWYVSDVEVKLTATDDTSGVAGTYYKLDDGGWDIYEIPLVVSDDGFMLYYYSVDFAGNEEAVNEATFKIDQTVPTIELTWDKDDSKLVADVFDETSDVNRVEFSVNGKYVGTATEHPYEWIVSNPKKGDKGQATVYDYAGNENVSEEIDAVSQSQSKSSSSTPVQRVFLSSNSESTVDSKLEDTSNADSITDAKPNEITVDPESELDVGLKNSSLLLFFK